MYSSENITEILDLRFEEPKSYEYTGSRPSDELIVKALDYVRRIKKNPAPKIYAGIEGIDTVIVFQWDFANSGTVCLTLHEDEYTLFAIKNDGQQVEFKSDKEDYLHEEELLEELDFNIEAFILFVKYTDN